MRKWFPGLRAIACLRRIAVALEDANELHRQRLSLEFPAWRASGRSSGRNSGRTAKLAEVSVAQARDWNERWLDRWQRP